MTPPAAAKSHATRSPRRRPATAQRPPRRVSGPSRRSRAAAPDLATAPRGAVAVAPPLALRLARAAARIGDARFLDRLLRGRAWIAVVAVALMGIVFIQVSMLRLNAGISRAITTAETLNRQNAAMRAEISRLDSGDRIADAAGALGMSLPPAGSVNYLDARKADGAAAARAIRPPKPLKTSVGASSGTGTSVRAAAAATQATATAPAQAQAATAAPAATTPPATTQAQAQTPAQSPATQTTTPAPTAQTQTQTQAPTQTPAQTQAQAQSPATQTPAPTQTQTTPVTPAGGVTATGQGGQ